MKTYGRTHTTCMMINPVEYADCTSAEAKNPSPNWATCWPWMATLKCLDGILVVEQLCVESHWPLCLRVNDLQHTTLALACSDGRSDRPDPKNRLVPSCPSTHVYFLPNVSSNLHSCGTIPKLLSGPVGWGCRIHQLHLCRGERLLQRVSCLWHSTIWW